MPQGNVTQKDEEFLEACHLNEPAEPVLAKSPSCSLENVVKLFVGLLMLLSSTISYYL